MTRSAKVMFGMVLTGINFGVTGVAITCLTHIDATPLIGIGGVLCGLSIIVGMLLDLDDQHKLVKEEK
jgi:hypothetical protein